MTERKGKPMGVPSTRYCRQVTEAGALIFIVELWPQVLPATALRASVRPVEAAERHWFADVDALARFFAAQTADSGQPSAPGSGEPS